MLSVDDAVWSFPGPEAQSHSVHLSSRDRKTALAESRTLVLAGSRFATEEEASTAGLLWAARLREAFATVYVGADFGDRAAHGFAYDAGLAMFGGSKRALNDTHGLMVYQCDPTPLFVSVGTATARSGLPAEKLTAAIESALSGDGLGRREQIAYDLLSASMSTRSADARFALLMMALESLLEPVLRSPETQELVNEMIAAVKSRALPPNEEESIIGSLGWLKNESIGQTGRRLAKRLEPRRYNNERPSKFFTNCYAMRSRLLHGNHPLPDRTELGVRAAPLELFVADLISLLASTPQAE